MENLREPYYRSSTVAALHLEFFFLFLVQFARPVRYLQHGHFNKFAIEDTNSKAY